MFDPTVDVYIDFLKSDNPLVLEVRKPANVRMMLDAMIICASSKIVFICDDYTTSYFTEDRFLTNLKLKLTELFPKKLGKDFSIIVYGDNTDYFKTKFPIKGITWHDACPWNTFQCMIIDDRSYNLQMSNKGYGCNRDDAGHVQKMYSTLDKSGDGGIIEP